MPIVPEARGPLSANVLAGLAGGNPDAPPLSGGDLLADDDFQLALYCLYELHYRGFDGVDEELEWDPRLLTERRRLELAFEDALFAAIGEPAETAEPAEMDLALRAILDADDAPSVSRFIRTQATLDHVLELLVHRSAYQLKEADPHSFGLPRLHGPPKAAFVEIQADEYGGGRPDRVHAELFAKTMRALGLDATYGAYLDRIPGSTLATVNLMSLLGLHRRWRGALAGHLAGVEMGSALPNDNYGRGLRRLGAPEEAVDFFDEHVIADSVHEHIAAVDLAGGIAAQEPELGPDVLWGARALVELDARAARQLMSAWEAGVSSLRPSGGDAERAHGVSEPGDPLRDLVGRDA